MFQYFILLGFLSLIICVFLRPKAYDTTRWSDSSLRVIALDIEQYRGENGDRIPALDSMAVLAPLLEYHGSPRKGERKTVGT